MERRPRTPSPTKTLSPKAVTPTSLSNGAKLWKVMHHPEWGHVGHPEPEEFFSLGCYWFCISSGSTPKSILGELNAGDRIVVQPKTMVGSRGKCLKDARGLKELRYGKIVSEPLQTPHTDSPDPIYADPRWYYVKVEWARESAPPHPSYKSNPCKTFTLIK